MERATLRFGIFLAAALLSAAPGYTQTPANPEVPAAAARTINLTLEQRHVIRELLKDLKVTPTEDGTKVAAGDPVPAKVTPQPVPALIGQKVPQIKSHRFYVAKEQQFVIVDPQESIVVEVIGNDN